MGSEIFCTYYTRRDGELFSAAGRTKVNGGECRCRRLKVVLSARWIGECTRGISSIRNVERDRVAVLERFANNTAVRPEMAVRQAKNVMTAGNFTISWMTSLGEGKSESLAYNQLSCQALIFEFNGLKAKGNQIVFTLDL